MAAAIEVVDQAFRPRRAMRLNSRPHSSTWMNCTTTLKCMDISEASQKTKKRNLNTAITPKSRLPKVGSNFSNRPQFYHCSNSLWIRFSSFIAETSRPTTKGNLSQFAYRYKSDGDDDEEPAAVGLGFKSASTSTAASAKTMSSFGRSKYTKMMVFHKAATLLNDESEMSSEKEPEPMISGLLSPARSPESRAAIESIHASDENSTILQEEGSNESEIDNLLSNLTLQDPSLERVIKKLTRKERREKLYKELLDISDTDSDDEDDDEDDDLIDNTGDYENDFILSDEELVEDEDETAAMLDYIENAKLDDDGQIELRKYYQDLAQKLSAFDKKLANEESKERKAKGKARVKTSVDTKEAPVDTKKSKGKRVRAQADRPNGSSGNVHLDMGESEVLLEPYSDEELHIVTSAMSAARRSGYTDSEGSESEVNGSEDGDNEDLESEDIEIDDDGNEGDLFEEALSEEESDAEEEEIDDDLYEEDEDDSEAIDFESEDDEEDEEDYLASENDDDEPLIYEEEEVSIIVEAVPPSLQRGTLHFPFEYVTSFNPVCKPCELNRLLSITDFQ